MAPLASEPRQLLLVLNPAKRKALYNLIVEIIQWMRTQLEFKNSVPPGSIRAGDNSNNPQLTPELTRLRFAALHHFDAWKRETLTKLKEILAAQDDSAILEARRKRTDKIAQERAKAQA